jgi:hypothetical protein
MLSVSRTNGFVVRLAEIIATYIAVEDKALAAFVASPLQDPLVRVCLPASRDSSDSEDGCCPGGLVIGDGAVVQQTDGFIAEWNESSGSDEEEAKPVPVPERSRPAGSAPIVRLKPLLDHPDERRPTPGSADIVFARRRRALRLVGATQPSEKPDDKVKSPGPRSSRTIRMRPSFASPSASSRRGGSSVFMTRMMRKSNCEKRRKQIRRVRFPGRSSK